MSMTASESETLPSFVTGFATMEVTRAEKMSRKKGSKEQNDAIMLRGE